MLRFLVLATLLDAAVGIAPSRVVYLAVKGNVTCFGNPDRRANVSILYRVDDEIKCPMPEGICFAKVSSRHVDSRGRFELREKVTLKSPVHPVFQLKADYGCVNDDDSESVDIPKDHVTVISESTEEPIEPSVWTHDFNYDS